MIKIIIDSAADITAAEAEAKNLEIIPLKTLFNGVEYRDGIDLTGEEFYEKLIESDELPTTSQITPFEYGQYFEKAVAAGDEVLCLVLSSKLSGCYQSAVIASEDFDGKVTVVDTLNATIGEHVLIDLAVRLRDEGKSVSEIADTLNEMKHKVRLIALVDTLEYLRKGGRLSAAAAVVGELLSIKPVIAIEKGEVVVLGKARGSKNANNKLTQLIQKESGIDFDMPYHLAYSGLDDKMLRKYIKDNEALYRGNVDTLPITLIGSTIGTHAGPGAIGVAFFVK